MSNNTVTLEMAQELIQNLNGEFDADAHTYSNYSGRGMFGEEVVAIVADDDKLQFKIGLILGKLINDENSEWYEFEFDWDELPFSRIDNLGLGFVYY